jgi:hypothetical protein
VRSRGGGGFGSSKDFEIRDVLEKEPRSAGRTGYQANQYGYLSEVKIERDNRSARSAGTKKLEPDRWLAEDLI